MYLLDNSAIKNLYEREKNNLYGPHFKRINSESYVEPE